MAHWILLLLAAVALTTCCMPAARPTGAESALTRLSPAAGSDVALAVGARMRVDPPDRDRTWVLDGGPPLLRVEAIGGSEAHWVITSLGPGSTDLAFTPVPQMPVCPDPPNCPPVAALPSLPFRIVSR